MFEYLTLAVSALLVAGVLSFYLWSGRRGRKRLISELTSGRGLIAAWPYTPEQWRAAAEEEFAWARGGNSAGHVYVSPDAVYIKGGVKGRLIDLSGGGRVVTHASFSGGDMSPLKLRVRRKVVHHHPDRADEVKYYRDDYRIPVPAEHRDAAGRVVDYFTSRHEKNLEAYAESVSDDEPLSLFGKDPF
jgi:hypothetical protein